MTTHLFPHRVNPVRQTHCPPEQPVAPGPQSFPHVPQLLTSDRRKTHAPLQLVWNDERHWVRQPPKLQTCPGRHSRLQAPQCSGSLTVRTHSLPHRVKPGEQAHTPLLHTESSPQLLPQLPQFVLSELRLLHTPLHSTCVEGHAAL